MKKAIERLKSTKQDFWLSITFVKIKFEFTEEFASKDLTKREFILEW